MIHNQFAQYNEQEVIYPAEIIEELTIKNPEHVQWTRFGSIYADEPVEHLFYFSDNGQGVLSIPRNFQMYWPQYFHDNLPRVDKTSRKIITANFLGTPRDYQQAFIDEVEFGMYDDILAIQPCGHGKTFFGVYAVCRRKVSTLVLVPTHVIALQWEESFKNFSDIDSVIATSNNFSKLLLTLPDVMIMSFDLFDSRKEEFLQSRTVRNHFGMIILDEAHRVGAPTYQPVLEVVPARYRLALTATFRRHDGMDRILQYHFGKKYQMLNQFPNADVYPLLTHVKIGCMYDLEKIRGGKKKQAYNKDLFLRLLKEFGITHRFKLNNYIEIDLNTALVLLPYIQYVAAKKVVQLFYTENVNGVNVKKSRPIDVSPEDILIFKAIVRDIKEFSENYAMSLIDTFVSMHPLRNRLLIDAALECIKVGRKVLFLSKRKAALKQLHELMLRAGVKSALLVSETANEANMRYVREEAQITFGIYQIAKEALDVDTLDTLILHHALKDMEQPVGRVTRTKEGKLRPLVIYPYDEFNPYKFMYQAAGKITKNANFHKPIEKKDLYLKLL